MHRGNDSHIRSSTYDVAMNYPGTSYNSLTVPGPGACENYCLADDKCNYWSYSNLDNVCQLKNKPSNLEHGPFMVSGRIVTSPNLMPPMYPPSVTPPTYHPVTPSPIPSMVNCFYFVYSFYDIF